MDTKQKQYPPGVRPMGQNIQIRFRQKGAKHYSHETIPWRPSPANLIKAGQLRQKIIDAIQHDVFSYAEFFPDSPQAQRAAGNDFAAYAQAWLNNPENDWRARSRLKYLGILNSVWVPHLHGMNIRHITRAKLLEVLGAVCSEFETRNSRPVSKSLYNDWLTCVRGAFKMAEIDGAIKRVENPAIELSNKTRDTQEPDPFDMEEADLIIADIYKHNGPMWGSWFELCFYTGMRCPSEPAALTWDNIDLRSGKMKITQTRNNYVKGGIQRTTKTGKARTVILNSRALQALEQARALTYLQGGFVFMQESGPVITAKPQRAMWEASLKRLKIRRRKMYNMRHTYATFGLMNGLNPAFMAKQLGHSVQEFFRTYATWIDQASQDMQIQLMEQAIQATTEPPRKAAQTARQGSRVGEKLANKTPANLKLLK